MRLLALVATLLLPDRLPSLIVLLCFWVPPAIGGWFFAEWLARSTRRHGATMIYAALATFVLCYAAVWFVFNVGHMPTYIPGASIDPTSASPRAVRGLAVFTAAFVLPGSVVACWLAFRSRRLK